MFAESLTETTKGYCGVRVIPSWPKSGREVIYPQTRLFNPEVAYKFSGNKHKIQFIYRPESHQNMSFIAD